MGNQTRQLSKKAAAFALLTIITVVTYQNCTPVSFHSSSDSSLLPEAVTPPDPRAIQSNALNVVFPSESIDFGKVKLGTASSQTILIQNLTVNDSVVIKAELAGSDFLLDPNSSCLQGELESQGTCQLNLVFSPAVTDLKDSNLKLIAERKSNSLDSVHKDLGVSGSGLVLAPSSLDKVFMVGWYSQKMTSNVSYVNRNSDNINCAAVDTPADPSQIASYQGQQKEFCFEPSGAHGLQLASTASAQDEAGKKLKDFVVNGGSFKSVTTLDQLFSTPEEHTSTNQCLQEALFYYALGYLNIPNQEYQDSQFDVRFSVHAIDDAIGMVVNNRFAGYVGLMETWGPNPVSDPVLNIYYQEYPGQSFPISLKSGKDNSSTRGTNNTFTNSPLKEGANTVIGMWLDDCETQRNIVDAKLQYKSAANNSYQDIPVFLPNVVQGYIYDHAGKPIDAANIKVLDPASGAVLAQTATDSTGFYRLENLTDGNRQISISKAGYTAATESIVLNHKDASTAIVEISHGL